jgi:hypothetical protein
MDRLPGEDNRDGDKPKSGKAKRGPRTPARPAVARNGDQEGQNGPDHGNEGETKSRWWPQEIRAAEWIMIAFTAATALSAIAGAFIANGQLAAMQGQLRAMDDATPDTKKIVRANQDLAAAMKQQAANTGALVAEAGRSATAAQTAATVTQTAATAAQRNAGIQLRAYVEVEEGRITDFDVGKRPLVHIAFKNAGPTPAYDYGAWIGFTLREYPLKGPVISVCTKTMVAENRHVLGPGGKENIDLLADGALTAEMIEGVRSHRMAFYIVGAASYADAFGQRVEIPIRLIYGGPVGMPSDGSLFTRSFKTEPPKHC